MEELMVDKFVKYCEDNFNLNEKRYAELYNSLSVCIIDLAYSLRARYFKVVVPIVERYAKNIWKIIDLILMIHQKNRFIT